MRELLAKTIDEDKGGKLKALYGEFLNLIYRDMKAEEFADAFAQTTTYILLMAKLEAGDGEKLDTFTAKKHIPQTFALIRELSGFLNELESADYKNLKFALDDILAVINNMGVAAVTETMTQTQKAGLTDEDDPFMLFYEDFLAAYNKKLRKERGVYYTPLPVARFIVRAVDDILKNDFKITDGLAGKNVTSLDFAAGTGTFMLENMRKALDGKSEAARKLIIKERLLPNSHAFEYLIAPYVVAHLKLSHFLKGAGHALDENTTAKQLKIYLTDTLEMDLGKQKELPFMGALSEETKQAQKIKEGGQILVIMGNPPYAADSKTASQTVGTRPHKKNPKKQVKDIKDTWIGGLLKDYHQVDGAPLKEKNTKWLQDDYVKFIRFAQHKMENMESGVVAIITNHNFLNNLTFAGMRCSLLNSFQRLYFLDLHGNSLLKETAEDGGKDENVFNIQTGVCISLLVKHPKLSPGVFRYDLYGKRRQKYEFCQERDVAAIDWTRIEPAGGQSYVFMPYSKEIAAEYKKHPSLTDIFLLHSSGIKTARDKLTIAYNEGEIRARAKTFAHMPTEEAREKFSLGDDARDWGVSRAQEDLRESGLVDQNFRKIAYRAFDIRHTYYTGKSSGFHCMPRPEIMSHIIGIEGNFGLVSVRQLAERNFNHAFAVDSIVDGGMMSGKGIGYLFPLYLRQQNADGKITKEENINPDFREFLRKRYGKFLPVESLMFYVYAVLHSPRYREHYSDFLRLEFPRIPFPKEIDDFNNLAKIGGKLLNAHLLKDTPRLRDVELHGDNLWITKVSHGGDKLRINESAHFVPVSPEVFNFMISNHRPLYRYLNYRKGRELTADDMDNVKDIVNAVQFTIDQMKEMPELEYGAGWKD